MYLSILLILLSAAVVAGFSRGFIPPGRGPGSFPGTKQRNDTDAIVIENTDGDNATFPLFLFRRFPIIPPRTCPKERSCRNRCSSTRQFQNVSTKESLRCFCDPECNTIFQDCCADYERYCQEPESKLQSRSTWTCGRIVGKSFGIWVIAKCVEEWPHDEVRLKCENSSNKIVLKKADSTLIVDESHNIFRNRYCAKCNHVKTVQCFKLQLKGDSSAQNTSGSNEPRFSKKRMRTDRSECPRLTSSFAGLRYCYKIRSSCKDSDNSSTARNCSASKTTLVSFKNQTYRNFHCLKCNHQYSFGLLPPKVWCGPYFGPSSRFDFSSMFRIPHSQHTNTDRCSPGFFYDNTVRVCRKLLTVSDLSSDDPSFLTKYAIRLQYTRNQKYKCFAYKGNDDDMEDRAKDGILNRLSDRFKEAFMWKIELYLRNTNWTLSDVVVNAHNASYSSVSFQILARKSDRTGNETLLFSPVKCLKLSQLNFLYDRYNNSSFCSYSLIGESSRNMECHDKNQSKTITKDEISIFDNGTLFNRVTRETFHEGQYMLYKNHNKTKLATCKKSMPTKCKYILKSDSGWKLFSNQSIYSSVVSMWFEFGGYSVIDGVVWLCLPESLKEDQMKSKSKTLHRIALTYSSLICLTISILSLIVLLFIYSTTPSLRNLPGKNLMLLCCVLALAQFLWLMQGQALKLRELCAAFSRVLHFLFIASFSSATSIALLHFLTFRAIAGGKLGKSNVEMPFLRYCLFSLGFPLVWVTVFSLLDYYGIVLLNYGGVADHCWLGNVKGMYLSFFAPVFSLLCLNFVLLLATVNVIRKCSQATEKLADGLKASVNKSHIWIYIRMATLMGFTWLLGTFQLSFPGVLVFDYLFVFVNGLQGFYIALAFLCTDNIKKVLSKRIMSVSSKTKSTSN